jgi:hypothetical protein
MRKFASRARSNLSTTYSVLRETLALRATLAFCPTFAMQHESPAVFFALIVPFIAHVPPAQQLAPSLQQLAPSLQQSAPPLQQSLPAAQQLAPAAQQLSLFA